MRGGRSSTPHNVGGSPSPSGVMESSHDRSSVSFYPGPTAAGAEPAGPDLQRCDGAPRRPSHQRCPAVHSEHRALRRVASPHASTRLGDRRSGDPGIPPWALAPLPVPGTGRQNDAPGTAALRQLLIVLRASGVAPERPLESSPALELIEEFRTHLRDVRGAAPATCAYYGRYAQELVATHVGDRVAELSRMPLSTITRFFTERSERWSRGSMKTATTALRSFFRFLLVTGRADVRLVRAVPRIPHWKLASIPRVLTDEQLRAVLASFDRSTSTGLRDHAMVTCLAVLGLRACEVVALRIEDFDWRAGTITVPATKTRREDILPLPASVARAVLAYLRRGRPTGSTRHVFVRHVAPVGIAAGPSIVRRAVRVACARAGLDPRLAGPHAFRHTVATRLLRTGATIKEVADVLRHRSIDTVSIYAKVDLSTLRLVVLPWPGGRP